MATTTNQGWTLPTVGGSEDTWGDTLNTTLQAIDTLVGAVSATELAILDGATVTTDELNTLDGVTATASELNTLDGINTAGNFGLVPSGGVILWSGSTASIPSGWFLCDGNNGTPNLTDRFVVGAGSTYAVGATGGSNTVTLATTNLPSHNHTITATASNVAAHTHTFSGNTSNTGAHSHTFARNLFSYNLNTATVDNPQGVFNSTNGYPSNQGTSSTGAHSHSFSGTTASDGAHSHTITASASNTGSGTAVTITPKYYALAYIMKS